METDRVRKVERAFDALSRARRGYVPLSAVALEVGLTPEEVLEHTPGAWEQAGDDWQPTEWDRLPRQMSVLTPDGPVDAVIRDSRQATLNATHANAVRHYLATGDLSRIEALGGQTIRTDQGRLRLVTNAEELDRLAEGAELEYDVYLRF
jgi:hypothetical protein